jgi:hypothetical protein
MKSHIKLAQMGEKAQEESLLLSVQQVAAPGDGIRHGALAGRQVLWSMLQVRQPRAAASQQGWRRQELLRSAEG